jgi:hypothetical protein
VRSLTAETRTWLSEFQARYRVVSDERGRRWTRSAPMDPDENARLSQALQIIEWAANEELVEHQKHAIEQQRRGRDRREADELSHG